MTTPADSSSYRVLYEDGGRGIDLPCAELGEAMLTAWRLFTDRHSSAGRVRVLATYMVERTLFDLQWSLDDGLER